LVEIIQIKRIPTPVFPPLQIIGDIIDSSFNIAIVSFALNISMSKLFAKKYKYDLDVNQVKISVILI